MAETKRIGKRRGGKDLSGMTFSRWTVISLAGRTKHGAITWLCRCQCGIERDVSGNSLRMGKSLSCGCLTLEVNLQRIVTHGLHDSREYQTWADMKARCINANHACYADYGGRGIAVCERWLTFENFYADMGPRPSKKHSLDRKNNDGDYCPGNCRWATKREQSANTRRNHLIAANGETLPVEEWARRLGCRATTIHKRLLSGWDKVRAVTEPIDRRFRNQKAIAN